jgi:hypothetical protein
LAGGVQKVVEVRNPFAFRRSRTQWVPTEAAGAVVVDIESPYGSTDPEERSRNRRYARALVKWALKQGYVPFASHLIYTQPGVLNDLDEEERKRGILAGKVLMGEVGQRIAVAGLDLGVSNGMKLGLGWHRDNNSDVRRVRLGPDWDSEDLADDKWRDQ